MKIHAREEMIGKVDEWSRSSMSIRAFAQTLGISKSSFEYWVRKVRETTRPLDDSPAFIEMLQSTPIKVPPPEAKPQPGHLSNPQIVLTFPNGLCLKIYG
jgi:transposase-like protein